MEYGQFCGFCDKKRCPRRTIYNAKTCLTESKRKRCYDKFLKKKEKDEEKRDYIDPREIVIDNEIWQRDAGFVPKKKKLPGDAWKKVCRFWKCLTKEEQDLFLELNKEHLWLCKDMDKAHLEGKGSNPDLKFEKSNLVLMNRLSHRRLTDAKDPITGEDIDVLRINYWYERTKRGQL